MIYSDYKGHKGLVIEGNIRDVSAECVIIMRQIYKRNKEVYNKEVAVGILTNMLIKAISENSWEENIEWKMSEEEKLDYTE